MEPSARRPSPIRASVQPKAAEPSKSDSQPASASAAESPRPRSGGPSGPSWSRSRSCGKSFKAFSRRTWRPIRSGVLFEQLAPLDLLGQHLGEHAAGCHRRAVDPLGVVAVGAPHQAVRRHDLQPFVQGSPRHRRTDRRQPDRIDPDVRTVPQDDRAGLAHPGITAVEEDELGLAGWPRSDPRAAAGWNPGACRGRCESGTAGRTSRSARPAATSRNPRSPSPPAAVSSERGRPKTRAARSLGTSSNRSVRSYALVVFRQTAPFCFATWKRRSRTAR